MNWDQIEGKWKEMSGKAQSQWGKLTNDDLDVIKGRRTELEGLLQKRYGYAKDKVKTEVDAWIKKLQRIAKRLVGSPSPKASQRIECKGVIKVLAVWKFGTFDRPKPAASAIGTSIRIIRERKYEGFC